ncbi:MAG: hypothetical protein ABGY72_12325 [bacterium]
MHHRHLRLFPTGALVGLSLLFPHAGFAQTEEPDTLARTALALSARQINVSYDSTLQADDPASLAVLDAATSASAEIHLGRLEGNRALRIGPLGPEAGDDPPRSGPDHELWLARSGSTWVLDARPILEEDDDEAESGTKNDDAEEPETEPLEPVQIPLTHLVRPDETSGTPLVTLLPAGDDNGELGLLWGEHYWRADFEFVELAARPRPERTSNIGPATSLTRDSDTSARWRGARLGTRNETVVATPTGEAIQVYFPKELGTDHRDFAALESTADGEIVALSGSAVIRLRSEVSLRSGDTLIPTENLAPNYPGSYGLWLKAVGDGWRLVFNHEADSWGTQHDPAFDAVEIDLTHVHGGPTTDRPLQAYLVPRRPGEVGLVIHWGQHTWTADFTIEP